MCRIAITLLGLLFCFNAVASARPKLQPGDTPPDTLGSTQHGQDVTVSSLHGKVVVISFWATWCGYCMEEIPVLAKLQAVATQRGLPLQVVAVNYREDRETFVRTSRVLRSSLPELLVTWDRDGAIGKPYGVSGIPVMVMLHRDGTIAHIHVGYGEDMLDSLLGEINALMLEQPAATAAVTRP
ncbi:TlpA disulfide reductase family protein [Rhodanobacter sp. AS-Z3]|uniref:TlpA family protein disulfide reductase n=1 Tax=Rhodanobacter sp. AS-Z3 TaxID=3031330 RepID=UPI00247B06A3|nr:TlpA disulfide reductase family protein [Rhodanobacter sp. AS-Z3]WEN16451.1 TlpA disulfide reductase family protein [Rhodanobacter sp. AS-Z3]